MQAIDQSKTAGRLADLLISRFKVEQETESQFDREGPAISINDAITALTEVAESEIDQDSSIEEINAHVSLQRGAIRILELLRYTLDTPNSLVALTPDDLLDTASRGDKMNLTNLLIGVLDSERGSGEEQTTGGSIQSLKTSWKDYIAERCSSMTEKVRDLIVAQQEAFSRNEAPTIAAEVIKSIKIQESNEDLVDITTKANPRISMLPTPETPFQSPDCNSGYRAASRVRQTVYDKLQKMLEHLDELAPAYGYSPGTIEIKVFEGVRSLVTQETLFKNKLHEIRHNNPSMTDDQIYTETCKWVSPVQNNTPVHSTGGAVDVRLWNSETNAFLDMGKFGVIWGDNDAAPTYSENLTPEQMKNRLYLLEAAVSAGLVNYPYEWWHLSSGDRYASYWLEPEESKRRAEYGGILDVPEEDSPPQL